MTRAIQRSIVVSLSILVLTGCQSMYFGAMEKFGVHKRDILVDRVEKARDSQEETKEQFQSALDEFMAVVKVDGGNLQAKYASLSSELEASEESAADVSKRIDDVERVAEALFEEWEEELEQYTSRSLRRASESKLRNTRSRYTQLIGAMKRAEKKIDPVLDAFRDQVLFLKHNLNARAIASLQNEVATVEQDIGALIREMEASIREADAFISTMSTE
ncbi:MAG: DUF2959 domain-containing protein [Lentisphaeria bacterium]|nr:DUF2959 domain-containing protein [Lentisphaeria bacterium]